MKILTRHSFRFGLLFTSILGLAILAFTLVPRMKPDLGQPSQVITIKAKDMQFDVDKITVKAGETVELRFENEDSMPHGISIAGLNVHTEQIGANQTTSVIFTPKKAGFYEFYCFVNRHRQLGMTGTIQVIP
jgi:plastocyanin